MAAFDFPTSPTTGDIYTLNGVTYMWTGAIWRPASAPGLFPVPASGAPRLLNQNGRTYWYNGSAWVSLALDANIANVRLLCHFEEFGLTGTLRNRGSVGVPPVLTPTAVLDTTQTKFTATSLYHPVVVGAGTCTFPSNAGFAAGTSDYTLEFWGYLTSTSPSQIWEMRTTNTDNGAVKPVLYISTGNEIILNYAGATQIAGGANSWPLNQWNHGCLQRSAGVTRLFVGGVQKGANLTDGNTYVTALISLGNVAAGVSGSMQGWMQEARFTIGTARYSTAGFTPPTTPFSNF